MVTYTHFGKQPDVLKHLVLCEVLQIEKPQIYVETNSACAIYTMTHTPEQEYGIYHFLNEANKDATLKNSLYYQLESESMANGNYLGSPALAMKVLNNDVKGCLFFDLEKRHWRISNHLQDTKLLHHQLEPLTAIRLMEY